MMSRCVKCARITCTRAGTCNRRFRRVCSNGEYTFDLKVGDAVFVEIIK